MSELPEELQHILQSIATEGFQLSRDAFEFLSTINHEELADCVREALRRANEVSPRPIVITKQYFETKAKTTSESTVASSVAISSAPARDIEARIEVVSDPGSNTSTRGSLDSFVKYFQSRFEKMSLILRQRPDVRGARSIAEALEAAPNEHVKFIAMIMTKRERDGKIFLEVDDFENTVTILVVGVQDNAYEIAQRLSLDQVVCFETVKGRNDLLVAKGIYLPDIPERKPNKASEPVNVALLSDIHFGSKTFLESAFNQMILWLNRKVGSPQQMQLAGRTKYVIIAGDVVDGVGIYPRQEEELAVPDIYQQYKLVAQLIQQIPEHMEVIVIPGNHDATRQSLPQPPILSEYAEPLYSSRKILSLGNPCELRLHGVDFLLYHGTSLNDVMASIPDMDLHAPEKAMEYLLRCRHLVPAYGVGTSIAPEQEDNLVVENVPDVFESGHIHVLGRRNYRGTLLVNSGAWQSQTDYQRKLGLEPTPGKLPVVNLQTLQVTMIDFLSGMA